MCEKFLNQTNNNAALSERASELLIYDIIHDFGGVVESLTTVIAVVTSGGGSVRS